MEAPPLQTNWIVEGPLYHECNLLISIFICAQQVFIDTPGIVSKKYAKKMSMPRDFTAGPVRSVMEADMGEHCP
jgi:hypothetical protein